jgi:hypothetical protein
LPHLLAATWIAAFYEFCGFHEFGPFSLVLGPFLLLILARFGRRKNPLYPIIVGGKWPLV